MTKKQRLSAISDLVEKEEISTQEELTTRLIELGYNVSQSTVSRDINKLNLIKAEGAGKRFKYVKTDITAKKIPAQRLDLLRHVISSVDYANNLVVIKTLAGNANSVGIAIDEMHFPEILGTVAGDDTLLIVARTNSDAEIIVKTLKTL